MAKQKVPYQNITSEHRRLALLQLMATQPDYIINSKVALTGLAQLGYAVGSRTVLADIDWLSSNGLLRVTLRDVVVVVKLTQLGVDVAAGLETVQGVARPGPE